MSSRVYGLKHISFSEIDKISNPLFLLDIPLQIEANAVNLLVGPSGSYKSFLALDLTLQITQSNGQVIYVAGEGYSGYKNRVLAWCKHRGIDHRTVTNAYLHDGSVNLMSASNVGDFVDYYQDLQVSPDLIIFDTLHRCAIGADENSAKDMGIVMDHCEAIREQLDCTILIVHHTGKKFNGARGSSALEAGVNTVLYTKARNTELAVSCQKQKNAEPFDDLFFKAEKVVIDPDNSSLVLVPTVSKVAKTTEMHPYQMAILEQLAVHREGLLRQELEALTGIAQGSIYRHLKWLKDNDFISRGSNKSSPYSITEKGLSTAKKYGYAE